MKVKNCSALLIHNTSLIDISFLRVSVVNKVSLRNGTFDGGRVSFTEINKFSLRKCNVTNGIFSIVNAEVINIIDGRFENSSGSPAIHFENARNINIEGCRFLRNPVAIVFVNTMGNIINYQQNAVIKHTQFIENRQLDRDGGAISSVGTNLTVENCLFIRNYGRRGGAISASESTGIKIVSSTFEGNSAIAAGTFYIAAKYSEFDKESPATFENISITSHL